MSSTRVLVLGALLDGPHHGYELRKKLMLWGADNWANIAFGSIYHALAKMTQEGLVEVVASDKSKGKTVYAITNDGRAQFRLHLHSYWREIMPIVDPFLVAITFMDQLSGSELRAAIEERRQVLQEGFAKAERVLAVKLRADPPGHVDDVLRLTAAQYRAQFDWLDDLANRLRRIEGPHRSSQGVDSEDSLP